MSAYALSPRLFGEVALAIAITEMLFLAIGFGLPTALLREPSESLQIALRTSVTLTVAACLILASVGAVLAGVLSLTLSGPVPGFLLVLIAARIPPMFAQLLSSEPQRAHRYGRYTIIVYGSQVISMLVAVLLALLGAGAWALIGREVALGIVMLAAAVALSQWSLRPGYDAAKARELARFGVEMMGSRIGDVLFHRYDNLVVGVATSSTQLGLYNQAYVVGELGNKAYAPVIQQVPLSVYAQTQGDTHRTQKMYRLTMYVIVRSVTPIALVLLVFPGELMGAVFGPEWRSAAGMLRALSAYAVLLPVFEHARILLVANGHVRATLRARLIQLVVLLPATVLLTVSCGAVGAGLSVAASMFVGTVAMLRIASPIARFAPIDCLVPLAAGLVAAVAAIGASSLSHHDGTRLLLGSGVGAVVYLALLLALDRRELIANVKIFIALARPSRSV